MRRFYGFNSLDDVKSHIAQVKTIADVRQIAYDISAAECNLTQFRIGVMGVWAIECVAGEKPFRHVFMTRSAFEQYGAPLEHEADSYSVLED